MTSFISLGSLLNTLGQVEDKSLPVVIVDADGRLLKATEFHIGLIETNTAVLINAEPSGLAAGTVTYADHTVVS